MPSSIASPESARTTAGRALIFHLLVRQIVERLQHQHPEHQDGIERLPAGAALLELVRCEHHRLDLGAKALPRDETINGFERIAPRRQGFQALIGIEKSQLPHLRLCDQNLTHQIRTGRDFFEVPYNVCFNSALNPFPRITFERFCEIVSDDARQP